jgi:hypothetical protein
LAFPNAVRTPKSAAESILEQAAGILAGMSDVETRLAALERSVRRWRLGACVAGVALAAAVAVGAQREPAVPTLLEARGIRLVDEHGAETFSVVPREKGGGASLLLRTGGRGTIVLGDGEHGPMFGLRGRRGKLAAQLIAADAGGQLRLYDSDEKGTYSAPE